MRLIFVVWLLLVLSADAQDAPPTAADNSSVIHVTTQFVLVDALVEKRKDGTLVDGLTANDFQVVEDRHPQTLTYFSQDRLPLSVVFLLDLTDTVRPVLKPLADGAREILGRLKPQDEVAVMVFSSHTELLQGFTTDRTLAAAAIGKAAGMKSDDGTFIQEDMYEAAAQALASHLPGSRRVMVWLTDGTANFENSFTRTEIGKDAPARLHSKAESTGELMRSGAVVAALIETSDDTDAAVEAARVRPFSFQEGVRLNDVRNYAEMTGGFTMDSGKKNVADRLALLIDHLRERYTLGYKPAIQKPAGTYCKLDVRLSQSFFKGHDGVRKADLIVHAKRGYYR